MLNLMGETIGLEAKTRCAIYAPHTIRRRRRKSDALTRSQRLSFPNIIFHI